VNIRCNLFLGLIFQVRQGKIKWDDCAEQALLRDKVMGAWPKDDAGWPKKMSAEDEAKYVAGLSEKERHCVVGLGGSQKAEVAWLDAHGIPYEELDVGEFSLQYLALFQSESERAAEAGNANEVFASNNPMGEATFNANPGVVGRDNVEGRQRNGSWSVSHIESESCSEFSSKQEVGGCDEQQQNEVLPIFTNPVLDRQHSVAHVVL
jgi:hypothetical protein